MLEQSDVDALCAALSVFKAPRGLTLKSENLVMADQIRSRSASQLDADRGGQKAPNQPQANQDSWVLKADDPDLAQLLKALPKH